MPSTNAELKEQIRFRVTDEQYSMLRKSALQAGLNWPSLLRSWITRHYNGETIPGRIQQ